MCRTLFYILPTTGYLLSVCVRLPNGSLMKILLLRWHIPCTLSVSQQTASKCSNHISIGPNVYARAFYRPTAANGVERGFTPIRVWYTRVNLKILMQCAQTWTAWQYMHSSWELSFKIHQFTMVFLWLTVCVTVEKLSSGEVFKAISGAWLPS